MNKKERLVAAIEHGTVIDHIPAAKTYQVASLLGHRRTTLEWPFLSPSAYGIVCVLELLYVSRSEIDLFHVIGSNTEERTVGHLDIHLVARRLRTDDLP